MKIATNWESLNDWQQREIIHIIYNVGEDFEQKYIEIIQILLMKSRSFWQYFKMRRVLSNIPLSAFGESVKFISETPQLYKFPKIKGLKEPSARMGDISIEQFSLAETLFYRWHTETDPNTKNIYLRQMVACLYRWSDDFNKQDLPKVATITDKIEKKEAQRIAFIFSCVFNYIADSYPSIFPKRKKDSPEKPQSQKHQSFSKIITMMAADELRLLGNLKECQKTLIYDFFNALMESKRIHEIKAKALKQ